MAISPSVKKSFNLHIHHLTIIHKPIEIKIAFTLLYFTSQHFIKNHLQESKDYHKPLQIYYHFQKRISPHLTLPSPSLLKVLSIWTLTNYITTIPQQWFAQDLQCANWQTLTFNTFESSFYASIQSLINRSHREQTQVKFLSTLSSSFFYQPLHNSKSISLIFHCRNFNTIRM